MESVNILDHSMWVPGPGSPIDENTLDSFEYDIVNYISEYEPPQGHLFWAGNFHSEGSDVSNDKANDNRRFYNSEFRIQKISFTMPKLQFTTDANFFRMDFLTGATVDRTVTVTWLEDVYYSVWKYHMDWLTNWYDIDSDSFTTGSSGKYRAFDAVCFHYVRTDTNYAYPTAEPLILFTFRGLAPSNINSPSLDMNGGNNLQITMTYRANYIGAFYNAKLLDKSGDPYSSHSEYRKPDTETPMQLHRDPSIHSPYIWQPLMTGEENSLEAHRLTRQILSTLNSEGRIA